MAWLNEHILWWHWIVLGIALAILEIVVPSFILFWIGVGAIIVGGVDYFFHPSFETLLYLWSFLSVLLLLLWFVYFKKTPRLSVGQAEGEYAHVRGKIVQKLEEGHYKAMFELPVLGDREWIVESREPLEVGDSVEIVKVFGQILRVKRRAS